LGPAAPPEPKPSSCYGLFFSTHCAAAGAKGATKEFIDRYNTKYGYVPDDVAALTWDSLHIVQQAVQECAVIVWISDQGEFEFYKSVCP